MTSSQVMLSDAKVILDISNGIDPERAAMLLALTRDRKEEEAVKNALANIPGMRFTVTEIGGITDTLRSRIAAQVMGACLNQGLISKCSEHGHALLHAVLEAERGILLDAAMSGSMALKIAVVSYKLWLAVAIFGESAFHVLTNHRRAGLGTMHFHGNFSSSS